MVWPRMAALRSRLSSRTARHFLWMGTAALALGAFLAITREYFESEELSLFDTSVLVALAERRRPWINDVALAITAFGSPSVLVVAALAGLVPLAVARDKFGSLQLFAASMGALLWTSLAKGIIERARPDAVVPLAVVTSFSFPSGHSLAAASIYFTLAILAYRHFTSRRARVPSLVAAFLLVALVAASRVYLGVHYPSDVAAGIALGVAWAFLLAGTVGLLEARCGVAVRPVCLTKSSERA